MTLKDYLDAGPKGPTQLAKETGLSTVSIWRIAKGHQMPPMDTMKRIFDATEGKVSPNDFMNAPEQGRAA